MFDSKWIYENQEQKNLEPLERIILSRGLPADFIESDGIEFRHDPFLMNEMDCAVQTIIKAYTQKQKIVIFGDYDADGITSAAMLVKFFKKIGMDVDYVIPSRFSDGYGLGPESIDQLLKLEPNLVITTDCGVNSVKEVEELKNNDVNVIITDHHTIIGELPKADAVLCCTREDNSYPFEYLSGAGVALKLIEAISISLNIEDCFIEFLPLAALGTVADIVPLVDENRIIVKHGLQMIKKSSNAPIEAIFKSLDRDFRKIDSTQIAFWVAPLLNAAGRLGSPETAMQLLLEEDYNKACGIAENLYDINKNRRALQDNVYQEIRKILSFNPEILEQKIIVVADKSFHKGIIGIVASKVSNTYNKPAIIISIDGKVAQGSGRSVEGFSLAKALEHCSDLLLTFGGHDAAAGLNIQTDKIKLLRKKINDYASKSEYQFEKTKKYLIDTRIFKDEINIDTFNKINTLEPFGEANSTPLLLVENALLNNKRMVGANDKHMSFSINLGDKETNCIFFNSYGAIPLIENKTKYNIIVSPMINEYKGRKEARFNVIDIKLCNQSCEKEDLLISRMLVHMLIYRKQNILNTNNKECFVKFLQSSSMNFWADKVKNNQFESTIERQEVALIYRHIRDELECLFDIRKFTKELGIHKTYLVVEILKELSVIKTIEEGLYKYKILDIKKKGGRKLETSKIFAFINSVV